MRIFKKLLIVFLALAIIPVVFMSYIVFYNARNIMEKEILSGLNAIADMQAHGIEVFFSERKTDMLVLGRRDIYKTTFSALERFSRDRLNPLYIEAKEAVDNRLAIFEQAYGYGHIMLTDMEGRFIYASDPEHEFEIGTIIPDKDDVFREARSGVYFGNIHKSVHEERGYVMNFAALAYGDADEPIGLVYVEIDMRTVYQSKIESHTPTKSQETLFVKRMPDGNVLFISPLKHDPEGILTKTINIGSEHGLPAQEAASGKSGSGFSVDYRGKEVLAAWRPIEPLGCGFVIKIDSEEAFLPIENLKKLWVIIVLVTIFSTTFSAFAIARSISEPIRKLHMGSEIIAAGNLDYDVAIDTKDEIGQLSMAFNRMAHSLNAAQQRLVASERLAALGKLTGFISHELRNPLGVMKNAVYYLNMLGLGKGNAAVQDNLDIMSDEIERSDKIISDLLDFYRVKKPKIEPCEINPVVEQALKRLDISGGIKLVKELQKDLPAVMSDASHMHQVFYNIGKNAVEAMGHEGILTVRTILAGDCVKIYFSDTGGGIAKEDLRKIFEPLVSSKLSGSGLGLAISKTLVESNGGAIEAESEIGKGATFIVTLPVR